MLFRSCGIPPLKLGYIPAEMIFLDSDTTTGLAKLRFEYEDEYVYFIQSKFTKEVSYNYRTDAKVIQTVHNKWINMDIDIMQETISTGDVRFGAELVIDGNYYRILGFKGKDEFVKVIERLTF